MAGEPQPAGLADVPEQGLARVSIPASTLASGLGAGRSGAPGRVPGGP
jgi:hypothetical protein